VKFLLYQQKYLEYLEQGNTVLALSCLRNEITPLNRESSKIHKLSTYLLASSKEDLYSLSSWSGTQGRYQLIDQLSAYVSPTILVPNHRLKTLLSQSIEYQISTCLYHNTSNEHYSLLKTHICSSDIMPITCTAILESHQNEVWCVKFSHNGLFLASASKDTTIIISDVLNDFNVVFQFKGHTEPVSNLSWSPNDKYLLSCGTDTNVKLWDIEVLIGNVIFGNIL
jgi:WD40 repeat protein